MNVERKVQGQVQKKRWSAQGKETREYVLPPLLVAPGTDHSGAAHRRSLHEGRNEEGRKRRRSQMTSTVLAPYTVLSTNAQILMLAYIRDPCALSSSQSALARGEAALILGDVLEQKKANFRAQERDEGAAIVK